MKGVSKAFVVAAIAGVVVANAAVCRRYCGNDATYRSPHPFLTDDHTLHYANALATQTFLRDSATNAGYDPYFMAGYAKSSIWPTNPLLELAVFSLPGIEAAQVCKFFSWASAAAIPLAMIYAGWRFRLSATTILIAVVAWSVMYWSGLPFHTFHYVQFGMSAFVWSVALMIVAGAALQHWLNVRTFSAAIEMGVTAAFALMAHPTVAILLSVPAVLGYVLSPRPVGRSLFQIALAIVIVVAANYWWLVPLVTLREAWGDSPAFFKNPNVWERLVDIVRPGAIVEPFYSPPLFGVLLALAVANEKRIGSVTPFAVTWIFLLAIPAGFFRSLDFLQVGRNTFHLMAWVCLPAAAMIVQMCKTWRPVAAALVLVGATWCFVCGFVPTMRKVRGIFIADGIATTAEMFKPHAVLMSELRREAASSRRVLFEVSEGSDVPAAASQNPYASFRLSPLLPSYTGLEVVGGPYLSTHYRTNFTNCGEGKFVGRRRWNRKEAEEYFRIYAIDLAVLWSEPAVEFARTNSDLFKPIKQIGGIHLYRVRRAKTDWEQSGLIISATYNRIKIENPNRARGTFVIPYHATPGWSASPDCRLTSTKQADDPVPFLTVIDPPEKTTLTFSPWDR